MKVGIIGLGKMGSRMVGKLLNDRFEVHAWNRSEAPTQELKLKIKNEKLKIFGTIGELVRSLGKPRVVWIMVPHVAVEEVLTEVRKFVEPEDIVIDGGNSNYRDTDRRFAEFEKVGVRFLGIGVSGGLIAAEKGYPMMVGGSKIGYETIKPILDSLSKPNGGHEYFGTGGAGHFVKMVHNGVEYGMMQSIGEGFEILEKSRYELNLSKVARVWQRGAIVSGHLMDLSAEMLKEDIALSKFGGKVARSGEGDWTIDAAAEEKVDIPVIETAVEYRKKSEKDKKIQNSFTAKVLNALRFAFGGHSVQQ